MNSIFCLYLHKFILVFFDDILIYNPNRTMHLEHVMKAFDIYNNTSFFIKAKKCVFGKHELEYLGHIVTNQGVKMDQRNIEVMINWPRPYDILALCDFLGLISYYRKFVQNYGLIARPLTNLLKKG